MKQDETFSKITFEYNTGSIPAPFCHKYKIVISKNSPEQYLVDLNLEYYGRDEITEEEIFDEGFTLDDNYKWVGELPLVWGQGIEHKLKAGNWKKKLYPGDDGSKFIIRIVQDNHSEVLKPAKIRVWELFAQELIQVIFELSQKESPLQISFLSGSAEKHSKKIDFTFSFAKRAVLLNSPLKGKNSMNWEEGQKLLKYIFSFDYLQENSMDKIPEKPGNYLNPGDGYWYELASHEHANEETISQITRLIETLKSYG